jgi:hypothetical protein
MHSSEKILVAPNPKWRGKAISDIASQNARAVNQTISRGEDQNARIARLNVRGVAALNHNDPASAKQFFQEAYKLDPTNAFSLNNMGYVSELEGDRETAETYYEDARKAADANAKVTYATRREAEGQRIGEVGESNQADVNSEIEARREMLQRQGGPIQLKRRDNSVVTEPEQPAPPLPEAAAPPALPAPTLPERTEQPPSMQPGNQPTEPGSQQPGGTAEPKSDSQAPATAPQTAPASSTPQVQQPSQSPQTVPPQPPVQTVPPPQTPQTIPAQPPIDTVPPPPPPQS